MTTSQRIAEIKKTESQRFGSDSEKSRKRIGWFGTIQTDENESACWSRS